MKMSSDIGPVHLIGIGGIGMSGIAEVLHRLGYRVRGSDARDSANVARLRACGIEVTIGHAAQNLRDARVVVVSSAIKRDNPELMAARARRLAVVWRAEMLAELMRFKHAVAVGGTHGKTTTTSLIAALLDAAGRDPTVINGGIINAYGTNARMGEGDWMVVESDESDGSFVKLPADAVIVTNIDPEHLDHYGDFDALRDAFRQFVQNVPFYGFAVMCLDHPEVQALVGRLEDRRIVTYGANRQADLRFRNVRGGADGARFDVDYRDVATGVRMHMADLFLPMAGLHNVSNAAAAIAFALQLGVAEAAIRRGLAAFAGVKRRFTFIGDWRGVRIFDDYAHHPVEIAAVLSAARTATKGRVVAVMQPHRYSRLKSLFDQFCNAFNDADAVVVAPVYAAGEAPIDGVDHAALAAGLVARGHRGVHAIDGPADLAPLIAELARSGDCVVCLGAGSISQWAQSLPTDLAALDARPAAVDKDDAP